MTDSRRIPHQHSDEHRQADPSPGADAPGEERPTSSSGAGPSRAEDGGESVGHAGSGRTDTKLEPAACDGDFNGDGADVQGDLDELVKTAAQRDEYLALAQRTQADFENYRKRVARESASAQARGAILLAKELLPALDNLDRALAAAATDDPLLDGVRVVRSELSAALARTGIESFSPGGEAFDPEVHEAVATSEQPAGGAASGTVVEVYQPGYRCGETIIRPARVVVAA
ncbi:MAG TPA: nucleotide exchange factor GrpE [Solirubrobacteraceae bacterium]|nr:nucleotide exchange factor GrpE [Solirubrobacteraceae bacterium]